MQITLTYPQVRAAARRVLLKYGTSYRYQDHVGTGASGGCRNKNVVGEFGSLNGVGCIVGEIMADLRVDIPESGKIGNIVADGLLCHKGEPVKVSEKALVFLQAAQHSQDSYQTWGESFVCGLGEVEGGSAAERVRKLLHLT